MIDVGGLRSVVDQVVAVASIVRVPPVLAHLTQRHVTTTAHGWRTWCSITREPLAEVGACTPGALHALYAAGHRTWRRCLSPTTGTRPRKRAGARATAPARSRAFRGFMRQETFDLSHDITWSTVPTAPVRLLLRSLGRWSGMLGSDQPAQASGSTSGRTATTFACAATSRQSCRLPAAARRRPSSPTKLSIVSASIEKNCLTISPESPRGPPSDQRQLIATPVRRGTSSASSCAASTPSLDQDLMLAGVQAAQLGAASPAKLANSRTDHRRSPAEDRSDRGPGTSFGCSACHLARPIKPCVDWLLGTPQQQGRLPYVQAQLDANPPAIHEVTQARLQALLAEAYRVQGLWQASSAQLAARAGEVVREALRGRASVGGRGDRVSGMWNRTGRRGAGPVRQGANGPEQLAQLAVLQQQEAGHRTQLSEAVRALCDEMRRVVAAAGGRLSCRIAGRGPATAASTSAGNWLGGGVNGDQRAWQALLRIAQIIEGFDAQARDVNAQRGAMAQERDRLQQHQLEVERLRTMRTTADQELAAP